jgi:hypothetical protein
MKYLILFLLLVHCSKDISFDPGTTILRQTIKFIYDESTKEKPVMEIQY